MIIDFNRTDLPNGIVLGDVVKRGPRGRKQYLVVGAYPAHQTCWLVTFPSRFADECIRIASAKPYIGPEERASNWMEVRSRAFVPKPKKTVSYRVCLECGYRDKHEDRETHLDPAESFLEDDLYKYVVCAQPLHPNAVVPEPDPYFTPSDAEFLKSFGIVAEANAEEPAGCGDCNGFE